MCFSPDYVVNVRVGFDCDLSRKGDRDRCMCMDKMRTTPEIPVGWFEDMLMDGRAVDIMAV